MTTMTTTAPARSAARPDGGAAVTGARHDAGATRSVGEIVRAFLASGRGHYLPMLLSDYGRDILTRKYDAFSTDRAYANRASGRLGPVGALVDRVVLNMPIHAAMRQRLALVTRLLAAVAGGAAARGRTARVLSAPCGLARDLIRTAALLRGVDPALAARVEWHGLDIDARGDVLPEAARRAAKAGVALRLHRADLFAAAALSDAPFDVVNCIGLTAWVDLPEVEALARRLRAFASPDAALIVDNWHWHAQSALGKDLEIHTRYHDAAAFAAALARAGWTVERSERVPTGACTVLVARAG